MQLHNRYFGMRHGISVANMQRLVISDIKNGHNAYGLVDEGVTGVKAAVEDAFKKGLLHNDTIILSSDFKRAYDTALIARDILHTSDIIIAKELRERHFGTFEKSTDAMFAYNEIWSKDQIDPTHRTHEVESVTDVSIRVVNLISQLEQDYIDKTMLLISHGDTLYILQKYFETKDSKLSKTISHFQNAEIRRFA